MASQNCELLLSDFFEPASVSLRASITNKSNSLLGIVGAKRIFLLRDSHAARRPMARQRDAERNALACSKFIVSGLVFVRSEINWVEMRRCISEGQWDTVRRLL
jgi:hypothetical protein